jgi:hypothetical protein
MKQVTGSRASMGSNLLNRVGETIADRQFTIPLIALA